MIDLHLSLIPLNSAICARIWAMTCDPTERK
jgi:hypothetical protein